MKPLTEVVPVNETRKCTGCGAWTWWAKPRQPKFGFCLDCAAPFPEPSLAPAEWAECVLTVLDVFPGASVIDTTDMAEPTAPGYQGEGAGPCSLCTRSTRTYGPWGQPLCRECARAA